MVLTKGIHEEIVAVDRVCGWFSDRTGKIAHGSNVCCMLCQYSLKARQAVGVDR